MTSERNLRRYGLSESDFNAIVEFQNGCCPICWKPLGDDKNVDHDRNKVGKCRRMGLEENRKAVRGVLHGFCNRIVGFLEARPWLVSEELRIYLEKPPAQEVLYRIPLNIPKADANRGGAALRAPHRTVNGTEYKWCSGHSDWHPVSEFNYLAKSWDGLAIRCRKWRSERRRERRR